MADKIRIESKKRIGVASGNEPARWFITGYGKSTVEKPTTIDGEDIAQGSWIFETDTIAVKFYDEETGWPE